MLNVYNHYISDYISRSPHYSIHKKRELRDIYKNIVKLSVSEPLYKVELSENTQAAAISIKENALLLKEVCRHLQDAPLQNSAALHSSAPKFVDATLLHRTELSDFDEDTAYEVTVSSLATGQKNIGTLLASEDTPLPEGSYRFTVSLGYDQYSFHFNVSPATSAFELQSKLSDFINKTNVGLEAQVAYNKERGLSRLELSASHIGTLGPSSFTLKDTSMPPEATKGLVSVLGLDEESFPAKNAKYSINNVSYESYENVAVFSDNIRFTFLAETEEPVMIRPVADEHQVSEVLENFIDTYNHLVQAGKKAGTDNKSSAFLLRGLSHLIASNYSSLHSLGITSDEEGYLSLDFEKARTSALTGDAKRFFSKEGTFLNSLETRLSNIIINPMRYVDKKLVVYSNPSSSLSNQSNPYTTSIYSGMLFNNYC